MTIRTRDLTSSERKELQAVARDLTRSARSIFWAGPWLGLLAGAVLTWLLSRLGLGQYVPYVFGGALVIGIVGGVHLRLTQRVSPAMAEPYERDLAANRAEILEAVVGEAVLVAEFEDEGSGYLLAVGPKNTLFLQGQYLYEFGEKGEGLRSHITVTRAPGSRHLLDFACTGEPVAVQEILPGSRDHHLPEDGTLLEEDLRDVVSRVKTSGGRRTRKA